MLKKKFVQSSRYTLKTEFFIIPKDAQCSETDFWVHDFFFAIFSLWVMVDFVFYSGLILFINLDLNEFRNFLCSGRGAPLNPMFCGGLYPPYPPSGTTPPGSGCFWDWIPLANWFSGITGLRFWIRFSGSKTS